ncbi:MAG: T9SS type A sorting domain-containing protein, partial [Bacteroidales bacterium]|nr:T9SS type A sorting domain-containing protein [Bacteroidales bacterium]
MSDVLFANKDFLFAAAQSQSPLYSATAELLYSYTTDSVFYEYTPLPIEVMAPRNIFVSTDCEAEHSFGFEVYPNPTKEVLYIEYNFGEIYEEAEQLLNETIGKAKDKDYCFGEIRIYTIDGKLLQTKSIKSNKGVEEINIGKSKPGQYLIEIKDCFGETYSKKIT